MTTLIGKTPLACLLAVSAAAALPACDAPREAGSGGAAPAAPEGGGETSGGGAGGAGGEVAAKPVGDPCTVDAECAGGLCLTQTGDGFPNGYCTATCGPAAPCGADSECLLIKPGSVCLKKCEQPTDCGASQECRMINPMTKLSLCVPHCTTDAECAGYGVCHKATGNCIDPEDCDAPGDEDLDGLADCEDGDCAARCAPQLAEACAAATPVDVAVGKPAVQVGDSADGSSLFAGVCSGSGKKEDIYRVSVPADQTGILAVSLVSEADLALHASSACGTPSELACSDVAVVTAAETLHVPASAGQTIHVFADGSLHGGPASKEGPYTITFQLLSPQPETEPNDDGAAADPLSIDALPMAATGTLDQATDDGDWFVIDTTSLPGEKKITAETFGVGGDTCAPVGGDVDTYLEILSQAGVPLDPTDTSAPGENEDLHPLSWCSRAQIADAAPSKYYLHVRTSALCVPSATGPDCAFQYGLQVRID